MAITKSLVLKSVEVDLERGTVSLKWLKRIIDDEEGVLSEFPHRKVIDKDDIYTLNAEIPDPALRNDIKKLAKWTK